VRFRRRGGRRTRILFATDLHGSEVVFRKFLNAVAVYEADVAILGGDLTGKRIVPVIDDGGRFTADVGGVDQVASDEPTLAALEEQIRDLGQYPLVVARPEYERLASHPDAVEERFVSACHAQVEDWMRRAMERLEPLGVPLFVTGGNDDYLSIETILDAAPFIMNAEGRLVEVAPGVEMVSTGYGNETPWRCPRDIPEAELAARIDEMARRLERPARSIFNLHVPPYGSGLDVCPRLDTSVDPPRPVVGENISAGSRAVLDAIRRFQPLLSLHGHIHESGGMQRIGRTTCLNPGSEYGEGILRTAVIDLFDGDTIAPQLRVA
jgi:Icc-related predicted phosphoesterase